MPIDDDRLGRGGGRRYGTAGGEASITWNLVLPTVYPSTHAIPTVTSSSDIPSLNSTFTPPASCLSDPTRTLTWDVGRFPTPTVLVFNQMYHPLVEKDGTAESTTSVGYDCFPPGYSWDLYDIMYFSPGACPGGYYQASSTSTTTWLGGTTTRTIFEGQCCPTSYTAYSSSGCYSDFQSQDESIIGLSFITQSTTIKSTSVDYMTISTSTAAFAAASLGAMFPSMTKQVQVIQPAVMIQWGDGSPEPSSVASDESSVFEDAMRLRKILFIAIPVGIVVLVLVLVACICCKRRRTHVVEKGTSPSVWVRVA